MKPLAYLACLLLMWQCCPNEEPIKAAEPFGDGMVVAKDKPIMVFGEGSGKIKVEMGGEKTTCRASEGKWLAELPPMKAGGPYVMKIIHKKERIEFTDVYVGTVLLLGGQSNLQFKLQESNTPKEEWTGDSLMRSFSLPRLEEGEPFSPKDGWVVCTDENAAVWSAIGYLTAKEIRRRTGEAVGIVNCYQGASVIEAWIPAERVGKECYRLEDDQKHFDHHFDFYKTWNQDGLLFETDIELFAPYSVSRVVWYQGESDATVAEAAIYPALFSELAESWREAFRDAEMPFTIVQLADNIYRDPAGWKAMQEAQLRIPEVVPNTVVVKCADICENDDIHPKSKAALSIRIADML